jgi:hypothetical protein
MKRLALNGLAAIVVMVALGGCGSSKPGGLTKAQYVARADAICLALEAQSRALSRQAKALLQAIKEITVARERADAQLQAIPKPASESRPAEWLHWRELATADTKKALESKPGSSANRATFVAEHTDLERSRALARAYGLTACARS